LVYGGLIVAPFGLFIDRPAALGSVFDMSDKQKKDAAKLMKGASAYAQSLHKLGRQMEREEKRKEFKARNGGKSNG